MNGKFTKGLRSDEITWLLASIQTVRPTHLQSNYPCLTMERWGHTLQTKSAQNLMKYLSS
ncbi:hypothetical protein Csa_012096 [Cucumis sativus]|nr:hypothetical protein Csa_012096 [Cucumis sativus]